MFIDERLSVRQIDVNVSPTLVSQDNAELMKSCAPEIRKYKKRFNSDILCAALWGKSTVGRARLEADVRLA
jgi:hypothetical protein